VEAEAAALGGRLEVENMLMYALQVQTRAFTSLKKNRELQVQTSNKSYLLWQNGRNDKCISLWQNGTLRCCEYEYLGTKWIELWTVFRAELCFCDHRRLGVQKIQKLWML